MKILEDFRTIILGFISALLFTLYSEYKNMIMGVSIIFILFSTWLMLVIWYQKKKLKIKFPLPPWLTGESLFSRFEVTSFEVSQHIKNGLPVYPENTNIDDPGAQPLDQVDLLFETACDDKTLKYKIERWLFKTEDILKYIKKRT